MSVFDLALQQRINALDFRIRELNGQIDRADRILGELEAGAQYEDNLFDDDDDDYERDYCIDSESDSDSDDETVVYYTDANMLLEENELSDTETVVGEWEDPFLTPDRIYRFIMPDNMEEGLDDLL